MDNVYGAVIMTKVIVRVHLVHLTNADQCHMATVQNVYILFFSFYKNLNKSVKYII